MSSFISRLESFLPIDPSRLVACLMCKALTLYRARTRGNSTEETFDALKEKLLIAMGHGLQQTRQKFWCPPRKNIESPTETIRTMSIYLNRITKDCNDVELFREKILLGRLMTLYPMDLADEVYRSKPSNAFKVRFSPELSRQPSLGGRKTSTNARR